MERQSMTYSELKTAIADFLNRSDLTSNIDTFIDTTEAELNRRLRTKDMIVRAEATADGQYLTLPTNWLEAINVEITTNDFSPIMQMSLESLDIYRKSIDNASGQPIYFGIVDNAMELAPTPDGSYNLQLTYFEKITALDDTNTSNWVSTNHSDVYLYGAMKHASIFLMEDDRVAMFTALFEKALEEIRLAQEKAEFAKGSLIMRRRTYGKPKKNIYYMK